MVVVDAVREGILAQSAASSYAAPRCDQHHAQVDVLEYYDNILVHSAYNQFLIPAVLRIRMFVGKKASKGRVAINRRNIFLRDGNQCQYCGSRDQLTIDHVLPLSKVWWVQWCSTW